MRADHRGDEPLCLTVEQADRCRPDVRPQSPRPLRKAAGTDRSPRFDWSILFSPSAARKNFVVLFPQVVEFHRLIANDFSLFP
jgi:hypothetical protein